MDAEIGSEVFRMMNNLDIQGLLQLPQIQIRPLLPSLVRMSLCTSLDSSTIWQEDRKYLLQLLSGIDAVNDVIALLSVHFQELESDAKSEQKTRIKQGNSTGESFVTNNAKQHGIINEFERSEPSRKMRLVLSEFMPYILQLEIKKTISLNSTIENELFTSSAYFHDISDVLCILCAELPDLLPLPLVAEALLYFKQGISVICKLMANNSESFLAVSQAILNATQDTSDRLSNVKHENLRCLALKELCALSPDHILTIRQMCIDSCQLPQLTVMLTMDYANSFKEDSTEFSRSTGELVYFASGLLLGNDLQIRSWFALYIRQNKVQEECLLRQQLVKELHRIVKTAEINTDNQSNSMYILLDEHCLRASAIIRLYCALKAIASVKFSQQESDLLLRLITCFPPLTPMGIRFVSLALGMLLACPLLVGPEQESQVILWIKWLASHSTEMENVGPEGCSFAEQLLLTAIHLHGDRRAAAVRLACSTLGMRMKVSFASLNRLKHIFTEEIFPTHVVAAHATKVPVTKDLNDTIPGYLPVHCVYQLLKTRAFSESHISVRDWVFEQICSSTAPLHPQLQPLIQQYVLTTVTPLPKAVQMKEGALINKPFSEEQILSVFHKKSSGLKLHTLTAKLLMLYYVLQYEDSLLGNMKNLTALANKPKRYSSNLINQIPVNLLLYKAQQQPKCSQGLYPSLLGLLITHLPHLCLVGNWMHDLDLLSNASMSAVSQHFLDKTTKNSSNINFTKSVFFEGLQRASVNPAPALMHLQCLTSHLVTPDNCIKFTKVFCKGLLYLLHHKVSRRVRQEAQKLWLKLNSVIPVQLWVLTVSYLQASDSKLGTASLHQSEVTFESMTKNPLLPLNVDRRILKCPDLLPIVLRILSGCLSASQSFVTALMKTNPTADTKSTAVMRSASPIAMLSIDDNEKEELKLALNAAQSSAAVQMLIEICKSPDDTKSKDPSKDKTLNLLSNQREVQCLLCSHLHQMFIGNPVVAKLVHFQGYAMDMIPVLCAGVPSMHICLDFIPEILQQSNSSQHLFAFELASHISCQYPLPKSLAIARLCVSTISTLITVVPSNQRSTFFSKAIATFDNFSRAFPPLTYDCVNVLQQLGRIVKAEISSNHSLMSSSYVVSSEDWSLEKDQFFHNLSLPDNCKENELINLYCEIKKTFYKISQSAQTA